MCVVCDTHNASSEARETATNKPTRHSREDAVAVVLPDELLEGFGVYASPRSDSATEYVQCPNIHEALVKSEVLNGIDIYVAEQVSPYSEWLRHRSS